MIPPATQANFGLELGMVFKGTKEVYERIYVSIPNESDRNSNMQEPPVICEFEID